MPTAPSWISKLQDWQKKQQESTAPTFGAQSETPSALDQFKQQMESSTGALEAPGQELDETLPAPGQENPVSQSMAKLRELSQGSDQNLAEADEADAAMDEVTAAGNEAAQIRAQGAAEADAAMGGFEGAADEGTPSERRRVGRSGGGGQQVQQVRQGGQQGQQGQAGGGEGGQISPEQRKQMEAAIDKAGSAKGVRREIVEAAKKQLGQLYVWGGGGTKGASTGTTAGAAYPSTVKDTGFDCSGLVQYAYAQAGISMPRHSDAQWGQGKKVSQSQALPGDLVGKSGHIGIYLGNGMMIEAPSTYTGGQRGRVRIAPVREGLSFYSVNI